MTCTSGTYPWGRWAETLRVHVPTTSFLGALAFQPSSRPESVCPAYVIDEVTFVSCRIIALLLNRGPVRLEACDEVVAG